MVKLRPLLWQMKVSVFFVPVSTFSRAVYDLAEERKKTRQQRKVTKSKTIEKKKIEQSQRTGTLHFLETKKSTSNANPNQLYFTLELRLQNPKYQ